jgi:hypothetical protein
LDGFNNGLTPLLVQSFGVDEFIEWHGTAWLAFRRCDATQEFITNSTPEGKWHIGLIALAMRQTFPCNRLDSFQPSRPEGEFQDFLKHPPPNSALAIGGRWDLDSSGLSISKRERTSPMHREHLPARFHFCVIAASPREVVQSALEGIVPVENVFGTSSLKITGPVRFPEVFMCLLVTESWRYSNLYNRSFTALRIEPFT